MQRVIGPDFNSASEAKGFGIQADPHVYNARNMELECKKHFCSVIQKVGEAYYDIGTNVHYIVNSDESDAGNLTIRLQSGDENIAVSERIATAEKISAMTRDIRNSAKAVNAGLVSFNGIGLLYNQMEASIDDFSKTLKHLTEKKLTRAENIRTHIAFADAIYERAERYVPKHYLN